MGFDEKFDNLRQADYGHCKYIWEEAQKEAFGQARKILDSIANESEGEYDRLNDLKNIENSGYESSSHDDIWKQAQKEVIFDDFHFLIGAIINRVRFLEKRIYSEDTYFKIASRKELFYWLDFRDKHNLGFSFAKETEEFFNSNR